ncbi:MAG: hypothetical protein R2706_19770 [Acidimicrobiales bacterium]
MGSTLVQEKEDHLLRGRQILRSMEHRRIRHTRSGLQPTRWMILMPPFAIRPKFDHPPRVAKPKKKAKRHWKLKAWKRRSAERQRRNDERRALMSELD